MSAASSSNQTPTAFHRFAERLVFGNRPVVLILFALITAVLTFFASQLRVDAGFKKHIPLQGTGARGWEGALTQGLRRRDHRNS